MTDTLPRKPIAETLAAASELLDVHGWRSGNRTGWGNICLHEAIAMTMVPVRWQKAAIRAVSLAADPAGRGTSIELVAWNDARGRTRADIDSLIRQVSE